MERKIFVKVLEVNLTNKADCSKLGWDFEETYVIFFIKKLRNLT